VDTKTFLLLILFIVLILGAMGFTGPPNRTVLTRRLPMGARITIAVALLLAGMLSFIFVLPGLNLSPH